MKYHDSQECIFIFVARINELLKQLITEFCKIGTDNKNKDSCNKHFINFLIYYLNIIIINILYTEEKTIVNKLYSLSKSFFQINLQRSSNH